jgi:hypothetical protein
MKEIRLTQGQVAVIDDEDYERISKYKWHAAWDKTTESFVAMGWVDGKKAYMHRFILGLKPRCGQVDHINQNRLDNQKHNLRPASASQNGANRRKRKGTISRFKGVCWHARNKKWFARIRVNGMGLHLGNFDNEEEAAMAYDKAAKNAFGEFALTNKAMSLY